MRKNPYSSIVAVFIIFLMIISGVGCSGSSEKDETTALVAHTTSTGETTASKTVSAEPTETGISSGTSASETFAELTGPFLPDQVFIMQLIFRENSWLFSDDIMNSELLLMGIWP